MPLEVVGVCPKHFGSGLPYGVASIASMPSAGASWQRPAVGRPISASWSSTNIDTGILNHTDTEIAYQ